MSISVAELYMLLGVKEAEIYKLRTELRKLKAQQETTSEGAETPSVEIEK